MKNSFKGTQEKQTSFLAGYPTKDARLLARSYCIVEGCSETSHRTTSIVSYEVAKEYLDLAESSQNESATSQSLTLCNAHYQQLYREVHLPQPCAACSSQPRYGGDYTCRCPHPEKITEFLQQNLDFGSVLTPASKICTSCYFFHRRILQQLESVSSTTHHALDSIVSDLQTKLKQFDIEGRISVTDTSLLSWNVCKVCLELATMLQSDETILLPDLYATFCQGVVQTIDMFPNVSKSLKEIHPQFNGS